jgi:uncharacterized HAD superfamily protein
MRTKDTKGYLITVDIDGVIADGECWSPEDALKAKPIQENIDLLYQLIYAGHHIILYTSRKEWWRPETEAWLQKNKVPYHALVMNKTPCDFNIDDKNISIKDIKKII